MNPRIRNEGDLALKPPPKKSKALPRYIGFLVRL
jgi:hypothetical protein